MSAAHPYCTLRKSSAVKFMVARRFIAGYGVQSFENEPRH